MARKPNYDFERREREKAKVAKKEERAKAKAERKLAEEASATARPGQANADQITHWNSAAGERWAALHQQIDGIFAPVTAAVLTLAALESGARVVDIGCGAGATVLKAAEAVGPKGRVRGIDVSQPMLAIARQRVEAHALANVDLQLADASTEAFEPDSFDCAVSRFGVMFFDDPERAFANIRSGLAGEARITFACWQAMAASSWFELPASAIRPMLEPAARPDPLAPGPFAFADPDRVRRILRDGGFDDIVIEPHVVALNLGDAAAATAMVTQIGPTSRLITEAAPDRAPALVEAVHAALENHHGPNGVVLEGAIWLASARAS